MSSKKIFQLLTDMAKDISFGQTVYYDCPVCYKSKKLGLTHKAEGVLYNCFSASCILRPGIIPNGSIPVSKAKVTSMLNKRHTAVSNTFRLPDYLVEGFASENSIRMAEKYELLSSYASGQLATYYDPKLQRQVFCYKNLSNEIVGAFGRALVAGVKPKAYIYPNSQKTPILIGKGTTAIIVEDLFSAVKVANYNPLLTGVSISGTMFSVDYLPYLASYKDIAICLDKDATLKSLKVKKLLDFVAERVVILPITKDLKDMTYMEIDKVLKCLTLKS